MNVLIIGGTRDLGHLLALELLQGGHRVTVFNRGQTPDELPPEVERLRGDRGIPEQLRQALAGRSFDAVVDTTLYNGADASVVTELLDGRTGHYIFLITGQVYLARLGLQRPYKEEDYDGPLMDAVPPESRYYEQWRYGFQKRQAEDALVRAWEARRFPFTTLRMPIVNSERDPSYRLYGYLLRLKDGGPVLVPAGPHLPLRHVYGRDVVAAILALLQSGPGKGRAYNISQDETVPFREFLELLAGIAGYELRLAFLDRGLLEARGLLPDCSPFSGPWMSELDNRRSKQELGLQYTPFPAYLERLVAHYEAHPPPSPEGYSRRQDEIELARSWQG